MCLVCEVIGNGRDYVVVLGLDVFDWVFWFLIELLMVLVWSFDSGIVLVINWKIGLFGSLIV